MQRQKILAWILGILALNMLASDVFVVVPGIVPPTEWIRTYEAEDANRVYLMSAQQTADHGYVLGGHKQRSTWPGAYDAVILKTDVNGSLQWTKVYNEPGAIIRFYGVQQTADGGYVSAGVRTTLNGSSWLSSMYLLVKMDAFGDVTWNRTYGGVTDDYAFSVQQTSDGGYVVAGFRNINYTEGTGDIWIIWTDLNGNVEWNRTYGTAYPSYPQYPYCSVRQTADGGYIFGGAAGSYPGGALLLKMDPWGNPQWNMTYEGGGVGSVEQTRDGKYIVAVEDGSLLYIRLLKIHQNGTLDWSKTYGEKYDVSRSAKETSDGGYIVAGWRGWLVRTDINGTMLWSKLLDSRAESSAVFQTSDGGYIVAGTKYSRIFWLAKVGEYTSLRSAATVLALTLGTTLCIFACSILSDRIVVLNMREVEESKKEPRAPSKEEVEWEDKNL